MTAQMEYLHMQHPINGLYQNATITGVPVILTAIHTDGSSEDIGTVITDGYYGTFSKSWIPQKEGDYKIIASFAGDDSYGSSAGATGFSVGPAPVAPEIPEQITPIDYTMTVVGVGIALAIIIIAAVAVATLLLLKKK
jgi:hypothetical protein